MAFVKLVLLLLVGLASVNCRGMIEQSSTGETIASIAEGYEGSRMWSNKAWHPLTGRNTNKCNIFVADVVMETGRRVPQRKSRLIRSPIGAAEWANPNSEKIADDPCWERSYYACRGCVIAGQGHVGIVTGPSQTTSASSVTPQRVVTNSWGFEGESVIFWECVC